MMLFDRNRATLLADSQTLTELAVYLNSGDLTSGDVPAGRFDAWVEATIVRDGVIDPTVAGIVELVEKPARSVMLEQFDGDQVAVSFVAFDREGRAAIMSGIDGDMLSITATRFDLLPAMLTQLLRINPSPVSQERNALTTSAGVVEHVLGGGANSRAGSAGGELSDSEDSDELAAVLGSFRHAWRVSGSWYNQATDSSITVLSAGAEGLWTVAHGAQAPSSAPSPDTPVLLTPRSAAEVTGLLGDVMTGRKSVVSLVAV